MGTEYAVGQQVHTTFNKSIKLHITTIRQLQKIGPHARVKDPIITREQKWKRLCKVSRDIRNMSRLVKSPWNGIVITGVLAAEHLSGYKIHAQQEIWTGQGPVLYDNQMNKKYNSYEQLNMIDNRMRV